MRERHGHSVNGPDGKPTRTYHTWRAMRKRCLYPSHHRYPRYGGRGITICPEWDDFSKFLADMGERPEGRTLDRIDTDGNYELSNCRWATPKEQRANRSKLQEPQNG